MNNILSLIGLAKKAGKLEIGEEPTGSAARAHKARLIVTAADAADNTVRRAGHFAITGNTLQISIPFTKEEMGGQVGRSSCAMLALTDLGFAAALVKKLAEAQPEQYAEAAEALGVKAKKAELRKQELRTHEKNVKLGKHKVRVPGGNVSGGERKV